MRLTLCYFLVLKFFKKLIYAIYWVGRNREKSQISKNFMCAFTTEENPLFIEEICNFIKEKSVIHKNRTIKTCAPNFTRF